MRCEGTFSIFRIHMLGSASQVLPWLVYAWWIFFAGVGDSYRINPLNIALCCLFQDDFLPGIFHCIIRMSTLVLLLFKRNLGEMMKWLGRNLMVSQGHRMTVPWVEAIQCTPDVPKAPRVKRNVLLKAKKTYHNYPSETTFFVSAHFRKNT